jgi:molybdopterin-guanine dinucleotide biosynthesis protein A
MALETNRFAPVLGGVLVGGGSRRMGTPKQLLAWRGSTLAELAVAALAPHVEEVVLLGDGPVPAPLAGLIRLPDEELPSAASRPPRALERSASSRGGAATAGGDPSSPGPLAGMLAAMRRRPDAAWVFAPCDLPEIRPEAVAWLLGARRPERWAVVPRLAAGGPVEPLLALYEPAALALLEDLVAEGRRAPRRLAASQRVALLTPPPELAGCWRNVNTPDELGGLGAC